MDEQLYQDFLAHHGVKGQKWGVKNGPPYPIDEGHKVSGQSSNSNKTDKLVKKQRKLDKKISREESTQELRPQKNHLYRPSAYQVFTSKLRLKTYLKRYEKNSKKIEEELSKNHYDKKYSDYVKKHTDLQEQRDHDDYQSYSWVIPQLKNELASEKKWYKELERDYKLGKYDKETYEVYKISTLEDIRSLEDSLKLHQDAKIDYEKRHRNG